MLVSLTLDAARAVKAPGPHVGPTCQTQLRPSGLIWYKGIERVSRGSTPWGSKTSKTPTVHLFHVVKATMPPRRHQEEAPCRRELGFMPPHRRSLPFSTPRAKAGTRVYTAAPPPPPLLRSSSLATPATSEALLFVDMHCRPSPSPRSPSLRVP